MRFTPSGEQPENTGPFGVWYQTVSFFFFFEKSRGARPLRLSLEKQSILTDQEKKTRAIARAKELRNKKKERKKMLSFF
jgi:hypothetical protein